MVYWLYGEQIAIISNGRRSMEKWFERQSRIVQIILLFIPFVNWVIEVLVRWDHALKRGSLLKYLIAIIVTFTGLFVGWLDAIWCLLFKHLIFCN